MNHTAPPFACESCGARTHTRYRVQLGPWLCHECHERAQALRTCDDTQEVSDA